MDALRELGEQLDAMEDRAIKLHAAGSHQSLLIQLAEIRQVRTRLALTERAVEDLAADLLTDKVTEIPGLGAVEVRKGATRKAWQSADLLRHVIRHDLTEGTGGEIPSDPMALVDHVTATVTACLPVTPSVGWRVTALRDRGVDVDEWCETTPGRKTVQFHGEPS